MAEVITKDMIIGDILAIHPGNAGILMASGMGCVGCPSAQGETLEEAAMVHGIEVQPLVESLNTFVQQQNQ